MYSTNIHKSRFDYICQFHVPPRMTLNWEPLWMTTMLGYTFLTISSTVKTEIVGIDNCIKLMKCGVLPLSHHHLLILIT